MNKIGILTLPFEPNYGWILQLWALTQYLEDKGYEVEVIDRRWNDSSPSLFKNIKRAIYYNIFCHNFSKFYAKNFKRTQIIRSDESMRCVAVVHNYDAVVVGSDQVWRIEHTRGVGLNFYLDFLEGEENIKRIAYAASFGTDTWKGTKEEIKKVSKLLKGFDLVSVREQSGVKICNELFDVGASHVLDPTMLLNPDAYDKIFDHSYDCSEKVVTYVLDSNLRKREIIEIIAKEKSKVIENLFTTKRSNYTFYAPVEKWLTAIKTASFVVVDSFHGMVFSILFEKPFLVIANKARGMARFESLLSKLGLNDRLITEDISNSSILGLMCSDIDYSTVRLKLSELRETSEKILLGSLL